MCYYVQNNYIYIYTWAGSRQHTANILYDWIWLMSQCPWWLNVHRPYSCVWFVHGTFSGLHRYPETPWTLPLAPFSRIWNGGNVLLFMLLVSWRILFQCFLFRCLLLKQSTGVRKRVAGGPIKCVKEICNSFIATLNFKVMFKSTSNAPNSGFTEFTCPVSFWFIILISYIYI